MAGTILRAGNGCVSEVLMGQSQVHLSSRDGMFSNIKGSVGVRAMATCGRLAQW